MNLEAIKKIRNASYILLKFNKIKKILFELKKNQPAKYSRLV